MWHSLKSLSLSQQQVTPRVAWKAQQLVPQGKEPQAARHRDGAPKMKQEEQLGLPAPEMLVVDEPVEIDSRLACSCP